MNEFQTCVPPVTSPKQENASLRDFSSTFQESPAKIQTIGEVITNNQMPRSLRIERQTDNLQRKVWNWKLDCQYQRENDERPKVGVENEIVLRWIAAKTSSSEKCARNSDPRILGKTIERECNLILDAAILQRENYQLLILSLSRL